MAKRVVIVGGGVAGISVLRNLLARKGEVREGINLTLIKREKSGWLSTCGLPFALQGWYEINKTEVNKPQFFIDQAVDFRTENEVTKIHVEGNSVTLKTGEVLPYDYLVIATGRVPNVPPALGEVKLGGVYTFSNEDDARKLEVAMGETKTAVIIGGGIIGLQTALAFSKKGIKTTVVEMFPYLLPAILDADMASAVKTWLEKNIAFILGRSVSALKGEERVRSVIVGSEEIPADMVLISAGMRPNVDIARDAGLEIGETRGILTDSALHVKKGRSYVKNVYAVGDCVQVIDGITHHPRMSQMASTSVVQAKVIADNILSDMTGNPALYSSYEPCLSPTVMNIGGLLVGSVGVTSEAAARAGIKMISGQATKLTKARYFPGASSLTLKLIFDAYTMKLIGAQIVGEATVAERVNEFAVAIHAGMTAEEIRNMERGFDPSLSLLTDVTINAAENALGITPVT